ncbi:hypothetical protein RBIBE_12890 [Bacillus velezensis]|nr:hypothetical protein RBIBE_12890 [Bacillus velezensis]
MAWSERKHICGHIPHMHTEGKKPGRVNLMRDDYSGLFVLPGNRKDEEHEMGFSGHSGRI